MKGIYLLLGSNLGDSRQKLTDAIKHIELSIGKVIKQSSIYATQAWGIEDQPDFLNQVVEIDSKYGPERILSEINEIERLLGRVRRIKWHSRIIDIDILYYGEQVLNLENLIIPHQEIENRKFALKPMTEIAPKFVHPILFESQKELLAKCKDHLSVEKI